MLGFPIHLLLRMEAIRCPTFGASTAKDLQTFLELIMVMVIQDTEHKSDAGMPIGGASAVMTWKL